MRKVRVPSGVAVQITEHALERYIERGLSFALDRAQAFEHLSRVAGACGEIRGVAPGWAHKPRQDGEQALMEAAEGWLMLGDDVAFALSGPRAVTCVVRGGLSDAARERRNQKRAARKSAHRFRSKLGDQRSGRPRVPDDGRRDWAA